MTKRTTIFKESLDSWKQGEARRRNISVDELGTIISLHDILVLNEHSDFKARKELIKKAKKKGCSVIVNFKLNVDDESFLASGIGIRISRNEPQEGYLHNELIRKFSEKF